MYWGNWPTTSAIAGKCKTQCWAGRPAMGKQLYTCSSHFCLWCIETQGRLAVQTAANMLTRPSYMYIIAFITLSPITYMYMYMYTCMHMHTYVHIILHMYVNVFLLLMQTDTMYISFFTVLCTRAMKNCFYMPALTVDNGCDDKQWCSSFKNL